MHTQVTCRKLFFTFSQQDNEMQSQIHHVETIFTRSNLRRLDIVAGLRRARYTGLDVRCIEVTERVLVVCHQNDRPR